MSRKTGKNPSKPLVLRGVPRVKGPTLVNGEEVGVEPPHVAISRMYRTVDRSAVDGPREGKRNKKGQLIFEVMQGRDLPEGKRSCAYCSCPIIRSAKAVLWRRMKKPDLAYHWRCRKPNTDLG